MLIMDNNKKINIVIYKALFVLFIAGLFIRRFNLPPTFDAKCLTI